MLAFQESQSTTDPQALILAEYTFITMELVLCDKSDKEDSIDSLTKAVQSFVDEHRRMAMPLIHSYRPRPERMPDAFLALHAVEKPSYITADETYPYNGKSRVSCFPKDAFHMAFIALRTRLKNILRSPGIDPIEKELLKQRLANLSTAQGGYVDKQKKALGVI